MSTGSMPEDSPHAAGGAPGGPDAADAGAAPRATGERRARLQALAGMTVRGSDGATVGRVRDIYLEDATGQLAAITVVRRQLSAGAVLLPASAIADLPAAQPRGTAPTDGTAADGGARAAGRSPGIRLRIDAATARAGLRPPVTGHATPQELRAAAEALGVDGGSSA